MSILPDEATVSSVTLRVANPEEVAAFYQNAVGLRVLSRDDGSLSLGVDKSIVTLLKAPTAERCPNSPGLFHLAVLLPSRACLAQWLEHALRLNIPLGAGDHDVSEAFYLNDPEGNGVEVYADRPRDTWKRDGDGLFIMTREIDTESLLKEAPSHPWEGAPEGTTLGHVHLRVNDLGEARAFYVDLLGFELMSDYAGRGALFVAAGGYHHHIGLNVWHTQHAAPAPRNNLGLDHFTVEMPSEKTLEELVNRLEAAGYAYERRAGDLRVSDPAGNGLGFRVMADAL